MHRITRPGHQQVEDGEGRQMRTQRGKTSRQQGLGFGMPLLWGRFPPLSTVQTPVLVLPQTGFRASF